MYEWYCKGNNCRIKAQERKQPCSNCKNNCVNHKKIIHNDKNEKFICVEDVFGVLKRKNSACPKKNNNK